MAIAMRRHASHTGLQGAASLPGRDPAALPRDGPGDYPTANLDAFPSPRPRIEPLKPRAARLYGMDELHPNDALRLTRRRIASCTASLPRQRLRPATLHITPLPAAHPPAASELRPRDPLKTASRWWWRKDRGPFQKDASSISRIRQRSGGITNGATMAMLRAS